MLFTKAERAANKKRREEAAARAEEYRAKLQRKLERIAYHRWLETENIMALVDQDRAERVLRELAFLAEQKDEKYAAELALGEARHVQRILARHWEEVQKEKTLELLRWEDEEI